LNISLGLLWHMHQPYYKDAAHGDYRLPWVRLHAVRGYYDMIAVLRDYPAVRCTFNIVPSLILQILDYTENGQRDYDFILSRKPAEDLSIEEKEHLLRRFFMCNRATMIEPLARYASLLEMRGPFGTSSEVEEGLRNFTAKDLCDLQVLFNLSWLGFSARRDEGIAELFEKGRDFSEADKHYVLDYHIRLMGELLPLYRAALEEGRIDITTTPFFHPIAPLVMNVGNALRCGDVQLPAETFAHPEDVETQIAQAIEQHERVFGQKPSGLWPAEGAVCPELVDILDRCGFAFTLSDEDILFASLKRRRNSAELNRPYVVRHGVSQTRMFFRDRALSDAIGFVYANNPPQEAAADFLRRIEAAAGDQDDAFVSVILDGENPWEHYPDSGEGFLRGIYEALSRHERIQTRRFCDVAASADCEIATLASGSWINQNFAIWIGHEEDRLAWEALARTRRYVVSLGAAAASQCWDEIYIAEGSDWFWWFGDEFYSANLDDFDRLFRQHLKNCYLLNDDEPPAILDQSILRPRDVVPFKPPAGFVSPRLDGRITHFYEWRKAGCYLASTVGAAMYQPEKLIERLLYGFDELNLYLRVDLKYLPEETAVTVMLAPPHDVKLRFQLEEGRATLVVAAGVHDIALIEACYAEVLEIKLPFATFDAEPGNRVRLRAELMVQGVETEILPADGLLALIVPDKSFERTLWYA